MIKRFGHIALLLILVTVLAGACSPAIDEPVSPLPTPLPPGATPSGPSAAGEVLAPDPARARDAAMAYLAATYGLQGPQPTLVWEEENTTPEGQIGASNFVYSAGNWVVEVSFPIVAPQSTRYQVAVTNASTGFVWQGEVDAKGQVMEDKGAAIAQREIPNVDPEELERLAAGNTAFAFALYQILSEAAPGEENLFFSPYSISLALAMTYAGARGETETEMAEALHFSLHQERLHPAFNGLDAELAQRGKGATGQDGGGFRLQIANALWGQEGYPFLPEFLALLARNYGAGMRLLDFAADAEAARITINDWVAEQTEDRIQNLIPPGVVDAATRLVLTNAIYFNAAWAHPFEDNLTEDGVFTLPDGEKVTVPMMRQLESLRYVQGKGFQAVELPYDGHEMSMLILLPDEGTFEFFQASLDERRLDAALEGMVPQQVALAMPKFEFESEFSLKEALAALGMPAAFGGEADFSGMTGSPDLYISAVIHKAFVAVDEAGTEAAAATAVVMLESAMPGEPVELRLERPFLFLIRDEATGTVLFLGRVVDPR